MWEQLFSSVTASIGTFLVKRNYLLNLSIIKFPDDGHKSTTPTQTAMITREIGFYIRNNNSTAKTRLLRTCHYIVIS